MGDIISDEHDHEEEKGESHVLLRYAAGRDAAAAAPCCADEVTFAPRGVTPPPQLPAVLMKSRLRLVA